jgi:microcystin-dependent protein
LDCTTAGTTGSGDIIIPSPLNVGDTVTDGTVVWTIRKIGSGDGEAVGVIKAFAGNGDIPSGYLLCDGSAVSRAMFPDLFSVIGTTYGAGDGSTTFNLPDYNTAKRFAQGDTVAGTVKSAGLPNIRGSSTTNGHAGLLRPNYTVSGAFVAGKYDSNAYDLGSSDSYLLEFDASQSNAIYGASTTVQPPALTCRYIIKAFDGQTADSALIDITQYAQELANKADRKLSNLDTANLAVHVVTESYYDDQTGDWYRVYDDGWVEQGGRASYSNNTILTVTLLKPMADARYSITRCNGASSDSFGYSGNIAEYYMAVYNLTTTSFTASIASNTSWNCNNFSWTVSGMGASA